MREKDVYQRFIIPLIERLAIDPEIAHETVLRILEIAQSIPYGLSGIEAMARVPPMPVKVGHNTFSTPIILAEGFDKDFRVVPALLSLGFGGYIGGTITEYPQIKNDGVVMRRLGNGSLLNHHGFGNQGALAAGIRLRQLREQHKISKPVGASIGINRTVDRAEAVGAYQRALVPIYPFIDFIVVNMSSPNTKGLRNLFQYDDVSKTITGLRDVLPSHKKDMDIYLKFSPDASDHDVDGVLQAVHEQAITAVVVANTTVDAQLKKNVGVENLPGGLSGTILHELAVNRVRFVHERLPNLPIIGMGGIDSIATVKNMKDAGARLFGIYTGLVYKGPALPGALVKEMKKEHL